MQTARKQWEESWGNDFFWLWLIKHPTAWPLWLRRAMFVTLPVSGSLWAVVCVAIMIIFWVSIIPIAIFNSAKGELWDRDSTVTK